MVHLQRAVEMSLFENGKNSGVSPTTILPILSLYIVNVMISKVTYRLCIFYSTSSFVSNFVCFREIIAGFDIDKSYNYIQHVI